MVVVMGLYALNTLSVNNWDALLIEKIQTAFKMFSIYVEGHSQR